MCWGFDGCETAAYGGVFLLFRFVAERTCANEVGIDDEICIGYKSKFQESKPDSSSYRTEAYMFFSEVPD